MLHNTIWTLSVEGRDEKTKTSCGGCHNYSKKFEAERHSETRERTAMSSEGDFRKLSAFAFLLHYTFLAGIKVIICVNGYN